MVVFDGVVIIEGEETVLGSHCNQWGLCCVVVWKCVN